MDSRPIRVLVADDEHDLADLLATFFKRHGREVQVAYDGFEALRMAHDFLPQVAILDINMPGMNGYSVARQMRQDPNLKETKLIAYSTWSHEEHRQRCVEAGFDRQLAKPCSLHTVSELIDALVKTE
jgi:two-component system CheB/CheR fusion protein